MDLKDYLFDDGNQALPAVRFMHWFGGGCPHCAFYRAMILVVVLAAYIAGGAFAATAAALVCALLFLAICLAAARTPYPDDWDTALEREERQRQQDVAERVAQILIPPILSAVDRATDGRSGGNVAATQSTEAKP